MKFAVTLKSPDSFDETISWLKMDERTRLKAEGYDADEIHDKIVNFEQTIRSAISQWVTASEYLTVEFNLDTKTCMVVPNMRMFAN